MLNKKILILGGDGMLGKDMVIAFKKNQFKNLSFTTRNKNLVKNKSNSKIRHLYFDINKNIEKNLKILNKQKFDIIINCIGIIKPRISEDDPRSIENALLVNSLFPHMLRKAIDPKCQIFQIATDCVFSGNNGNYTESSLHDATDIYGKSKSLGEVKSDNFFNIRSSIIGRELKYKYSLLEWYLSQANRNINGFIDHNWNGLSTIVFSNLICAILINGISLPNTIHIIPKNTVNKFELLKIFENKFNINAKINSFKSQKPIDRTLNTNNKKLNSQIWNSSIYKKKLNITEIVNTII